MQAKLVFNKLWQPQLGKLQWENLALSVEWDFSVCYCSCILYELLQVTTAIHTHIYYNVLNFKFFKPKISTNKPKHWYTYHKVLWKLFLKFVCSNSSVVDVRDVSWPGKIFFSRLWLSLLQEYWRFNSYEMLKENHSCYKRPASRLVGI
jgi:hypothetical protein